MADEVQAATEASEEPARPPSQPPSPSLAMATIFAAPAPPPPPPPPPAPGLPGLALPFGGLVPKAKIVPVHKMKQLHWAKVPEARVKGRVRPSHTSSCSPPYKLTVMPLRTCVCVCVCVCRDGVDRGAGRCGAAWSVGHERV
jgi:hypothetical protein